MDNNNHPQNDPRLNPEVRREMVNDALRDFFKKHGYADNTPQMQAVIRAKNVHADIWNTVVEVLKIEKEKGQPFDEGACYALLEKLHIDFFRSFSKDDLLYIFAILNAEAMLEKAKEWVAAF